MSSPDAAGRGVGAAVIGLGFMGRTHVGAYAEARRTGVPNRLVAVCDQDPERRAGRAGSGGNIDVGGEELLFDATETRGYETVADLLADPEVELVSVCTPTETHVDVAIQALEAGKHVLVEKPVALSSAEVERLADAARAAPTLCMPAMCVRFWPGWSWLKARIDDGTYGRVGSAVFRRLGSRPTWASFYADSERSGGALFDLHVHDADFVRHCFGPPTSVSSSGSLDHVTTLYRFADGPPHVVVEGGWDHTAGFEFQMAFTAVFERATAEYDFRAGPKLTVAHDGEVEEIALEDTTGWALEVRHLLLSIGNGTDPGPSAEEALHLTRMLEAERESLASGAAIRVTA